MRITNWFRRTRGFSGGVYLPILRERSPDPAIKTLAVPPILDVPMLQHDGSPAEVCVQVGRHVVADELIGRAARPDALNVHAPLAGEVQAIGRVDTAWHTDVPAVRIQPVANLPDSSGLSRIELPPANLIDSVETLAAIADRAGLCSHRQPAISLADHLRWTVKHKVRHVIISTLQPEPLVTSDQAVFDTFLSVAVHMGGTLGTLLKAKRVYLAVDRQDRWRMHQARASIVANPARLRPMANKYPQHVPVLLAASLTDRHAPPGGVPEQVGVSVFSASDLIALAAACPPNHRPATHRVVCIAGPAITRPGHYLLPIGIRISDVLRQVSFHKSIRRVVDGGPITGRTVATLDAVVTQRTSTLLFIDSAGDPLADPGPCVRCGWCQEDCPVGLDPQALLDCYERGQFEQAAGYHPQACVQCGLCSYVCPAELPLALAAGQLKMRFGGAGVLAASSGPDRGETGGQDARPPVATENEPD